MIIPGFFGARSGSNFPIKYVGGKATTSEANSIDVGSGLTGGVSSTPSSGDFVVAALAYIHSSAATLDTESGDWTEDLNILETGGSHPINFATAYRELDLTNTSVSWTLPSSSGNIARGCVATVWRGVDSTTPLDTTSLSANNTSSILGNPPSITTSNDRCMILGLVGSSDLGGTNTHTHGDSDHLIAGYHNETSNPDAHFAIAAFQQDTAGAFDAAAFGFSGTDQSWYTSIAIAMALRAA